MIAFGNCNCAAAFPARQKNMAPKPEPIPRVQIEELVAHTTHTVQCVASRYTCSVCNGSFKISDPGFKHWLSLQCVAPASQARFHTPVRIDSSIHIGNRITHVSHRLYKHRGLIYCSRCGARAGSNQIRNLGAHCQPPNSGVLAVLRAIRQDRMPPGLTEWPE